jgi:hypothetical protein
MKVVMIGVTLGVVALFVGERVYEHVRQQRVGPKECRQGMVQDLLELRFNASLADAAHRSEIGDAAVARAADFSDEDLPVELREWVMALRRERGVQR